MGYLGRPSERLEGTGERPGRSCPAGHCCAQGELSLPGPFPSSVPVASLSPPPLCCMLCESVHVCACMRVHMCVHA